MPKRDGDHAGYDSEGRELVWVCGGTMKMHKDVSEQVEAEYEKWLAAAVPAPEKL